MTLDSTQDLFFLVLSIATGWVAVFVCWGLYEVAKILHQANAVVTETRDKLNRLEKAVLAIKERLESSVSYLGMLAEGGKSLLGLFHKREERRAKRSSRKKKTDEDDEDEDDL